MAESPGEREGHEDRDPLHQTQESPARSASTVGVGSALGIGCVVALLVLVLVAILMRTFIGAW
jgi:hypothetical protein